MERICLPFKRVVFNLEKLKAHEGQPVGGVPKWLTEGVPEDQAGVRLQAALLLVAAAGLFAVAGYLQNWMPLTIGGAAVAGATALVNVLSGLVPQIQKDMDGFFIRHASRLRWLGGGLLALGTLACMIAVWLHVSDS